MTAFENAYNFALGYVMYMFEGEKDINKEDIYFCVESNLRDWDAFAGPRHTNYNPAEYELTDSEWDDCLVAVCETAEARLLY